MTKLDFPPKPLPRITMINAPFFEAAAQGRLLLQRCRPCGHLFYFPRPACPRCFSIDLDWEEVSRLGTVYSYAFVHRPQHPAFMDQVPIKLVAVRLDAGPLIVSSLVDEESVDVAIGDRVEAVFEVFAAGVALPRFRMLPRDRRETSTVVW